MAASMLAKWSVLAVLLLISFLSFSSQYLFLNLEPGFLTETESVVFNISIFFLLVCYARTIRTDPGRIPVPKGAKDDALDSDANAESILRAKQRWCRRCELPKPPRAHHCKVCKRCIPKMDHHCPWTVNCVSHMTFPHFIRFVLYAVIAMTYLAYFLYIRAAVLWNNRKRPSYHGPSAPQLAHLFVLIVANSITLFALAFLLIRSLWSLLWNITTIEGWELERHETLLRRARYTGGYLDGPDGLKVRIVRQEFPYDIGIWGNLKQGMGTANVLAWFWPFASSPSLSSSLDFPKNGFEDPSVTWPPPDPDRIPRLVRNLDPKDAFIHQGEESMDKNSIEAFHKRQQEDLKRWDGHLDTIHRRRPFNKRYDENAIRSNDTSSPQLYVDGDEPGEESWRNSEGEKLGDFGVDEEVEFYDDDEMPLAELIKKRKLQGGL